jgi:alanyl-tRNA synthetase
MGDLLREKLSSGVGILAAVIDGKVSLVCVVTDDVIKERGVKAGTIVGAIAKQLGGGGGGKPHLATAGAKDAHKLNETLQNAAAIVQQSSN